MYLQNIKVGSLLTSWGWWSRDRGHVSRSDTVSLSHRVTAHFNARGFGLWNFRKKYLNMDFLLVSDSNIRSVDKLTPWISALPRGLTLQ